MPSRLTWAGLGASVELEHELACSVRLLRLVRLLQVEEPSDRRTGMNACHELLRVAQAARLGWCLTSSAELDERQGCPTRGSLLTSAVK